jgi:hypothetical protein
MEKTKSLHLMTLEEMSELFKQGLERENEERKKAKPRFKKDGTEGIHEVPPNDDSMGD